MPNTESKRSPTYAELADLLCELVENNIANLDGMHPFVKCFTFGGSNAPDHWHRAIRAREALISSKLASRQHRKYSPKLIRPMSAIAVGKPYRLSFQQLRMLRGAAAGNPYQGIHGQSAHGGAHATAASLVRRDLLTAHLEITKEGRAAIKETK